jgi:phthiocerol/phenolphthiocerol synthesis type-I polyketide synthase E
VAVHLACQSLLLHESDVALAGAAAVRLLDPQGHRYEEAGILSSDGHCRPYDADATGTVVGDGVGVVVLKRLDDALAAGDRVRAVILGSAVNNDGAGKAGFTAPSPRAQAAAISEALAVAGVDPATVGYVEGHGTATPLGDPIEVRALADAFGTGLPAGGCLLGSVKGNVGHLDTAAGITGLIKTALAVEHGVIPPTLHFRRPNDEAALDSSPFRVVTETTPWPRARPRRAGVSSFGIGGTNVHVVVEGPPPTPSAPAPARAWHVLPVSARSEAALDAATGRLAAHLDAGVPEADDLADIAYTLQVGRAAFAHRRVVVGRDRAGLRAALGSSTGDRAPAAAAPGSAPSVVFLLPGQGSQHAGMGAQLYAGERVFREAMDACADGFASLLGWDVRDVAFARGEGASDRLRQTLHTQPAVFSVDYALARQLMAWGVQPAAMLGHSLGELVAACLAGVFTLDGALRVVAARAELMQTLAPGRLVAVRLDEASVREALDGCAAIVAVNGPDSCVIGGGIDEVAEAVRRLDRRSIATRDLETSHAFHTRLIEPALPGLGEVLDAVGLDKPARSFLSNVSGTWITDAEATDPAYWVRHARQPVRFADGVAAVMARGPAVFVEVGPGRALSGLVRTQTRSSEGGPAGVVATMPHRRDGDPGEDRAVLDAVAELWRRGADVEWAALHEGERRRRVPLPTYPFERRSYLIPRAGEGDGDVTATRSDPASWSYVPVWHPAPLTPEAEAEVEVAAARPGSWLVLEDPGGLAARLVAGLRRQGHTVAVARAHDRYARIGDDDFLVDPSDPEGLRRVVAELRGEGRSPTRVVHAWCVTKGPAADRDGGADERYTAAQDVGFHALTDLARALGEAGDAGPVGLDVITDDLHDVTGEGVRRPERATVLGAARVLDDEFAALHTRCIDVSRLDGDGDWSPLIESLLAELARSPAATAERRVALRHGRRWRPAFAPVELAPGDGSPGGEPGAGYLVTGASGEAGLLAAERLAASGARVVMVVDDVPASTGESDTKVAARVERRAALVAAHPDEVTAVVADETDPDQLRAAVEAARARLGRIHGVVHAVDVRGTGMAALKSRGQSAGVLDARVHSTLVLDEALHDDEGEVFLLLSSTTGLLGGVGQLENAAAATFLDAAASARLSRGRPATALDVAQWDWDDWHERQAGPSGLRDRFAEHRHRHGIPADAGLALAWAAAASGLAQVVLSTVEVRDLLAGQSALTPSALLDSLGGPTGDGSGGDGWDPATAWPDDEVACSVARVWHEVLGVSPIGPDDDFFELGGNSLFAIQIVARLRQLHGDLPMSVIFEAATVPGVAAAIREQQMETIGLDEFDALLQEIEGLSPEEAEARLNQSDSGSRS